MLSLAIAYKNAGLELLRFLEKLFPHIIGKPSFLQSVERAGKASLKRETLNGLLERLITLQNALKLEVVTALRADINQQQLATNGQFNAINHDVQVIIQQLGKSPIRDEQRLRVVINDCLSQYFKNFFVPQQNTTQGPRHDQPCRDIQKEKSILRMLYFRQIQDRRQEVAEACSRTFEWIFHPPAGHYPWSSFVTFLEEYQTLPYWINGKAGSGKSTLIKFILRHPQLRRSLLRWAGKTELTVVSFFLWNQGTPLQKSHVGLLRSLLYTVLESRPEWIAEVFPRLWENWKVTDADEPPSLVEVRQGFEKLLSRESTRLCILIDGVDEFDGDRNELATYLKSLCGPYTKVILSSRPIPDSVAAFQMCPQLRLQDLTVDDIRIFVKSHLVEHVQVKNMLRAHPVEANELVRELQEMADGVFLWVRLVIKLLVEGIQKEEQITDLQRRLRAMPPTLELLYMRMMENMDAIHQVRAAETFQIVESWNAKEMRTPLTALLFSATEFGDVPAKGPLKLSEITDRCTKVEASIRNRCCGLLEVHRNYEAHKSSSRTGQGWLIDDFTAAKPDDIAIAESSIQYLHRTVAEFLHTDAIWSKIRSLTPESFDPDSRLANACYFIIRHQPTTSRATGGVWNWVNNYAVFARGIDTADDVLYLKQMFQFDATMAEFHQATQSNDSLHWSSHWPLETAKKFGDSALENRLLKGHSFTTFAVRMGFNRLLRLQPGLLTSGTPYEIYAMDSWFNRGFIPPQNIRAETLRLVLRDGRANARVGTHSSWQFAIHLLDTTMHSGFALDACQLLEIYILAGAAVNDRYGNRSALDVANSLRYYRGGREVSEINDEEKGSGSEYLIFDESQIHQYAQKLEVLLRARGAVSQYISPTLPPTASNARTRTPGYQPSLPFIQPTRNEWESSFENDFRQLSILPRPTQSVSSTSYPVPGHDRLSSRYPGQIHLPTGYFDSMYGYPAAPLPSQALGSHGNGHPHQGFSYTMYPPASGPAHGHPIFPKRWPT